jgi:hypothetical protein
MARLRTSPYLPGVRSRLWRFVPAGPFAATTAESNAAAQAAGPAESIAGEAGAGPVMALIRRLPLDD